MEDLELKEMYEEMQIDEFSQGEMEPVEDVTVYADTIQGDESYEPEPFEYLYMPWSYHQAQQKMVGEGKK